MFYKLDNEQLLMGNTIRHKEFELFTDKKDTYELPIMGWQWFDTIEEACAHFGLDINDYVEEDN